MPDHRDPDRTLHEMFEMVGLVAAVKIHCEFLAADRWQVEVKRRIGVHDGCGVAAVARGGSSGQRLPM
jgi:hypothetical protein